MTSWLLGVATFLLSAGAFAADVTVQAAASLTNAFRELAPAFEAAHPGATLQFNFGASGALLQQIDKGAPADVFASADQQTMDDAQARKLIEPSQRKDFVSNALVVIVPRPAANVPGALPALAEPAIARIAIGLPASVPVGRYTQSVLEAAGLWRAIEPKMIGAHNVRQALDYVARGEVDAGFVYATDAALMTDKVRVAFTVATAQPILYPVAALAGAPNAAGARQFVAFLFTPTARAVLAKYGFGTP
jgi:molybdate transport system substrate-binding protein